MGVMVMMAMMLFLLLLFTVLLAHHVHLALSHLQFICALNTAPIRNEQHAGHLQQRERAMPVRETRALAVCTSTLSAAAHHAHRTSHVTHHEHVTRHTPHVTNLTYLVAVYLFSRPRREGSTARCIQRRRLRA